MVSVDSQVIYHRSDSDLKSPVLWDKCNANVQVRPLDSTLNRYRVELVRIRCQQGSQDLAVGGGARAWRAPGLLYRCMENALNHV